MTLEDQQGASVAASEAFAPMTAWAELEEARVRHERAIDEVRAARREEATMKARHRAQHGQEVKAAADRVLDGEAAVDPAEHEEARRREQHAISVRIQAAHLARRDAVAATLRTVREHPEWAEEVAGRRAAAEAERAELLAQAEAARRRAWQESHMLRWLERAATEALVPQPYRAPGPPPPPEQTVAEVFGSAA